MKKHILILFFSWLLGLTLSWPTLAHGRPVRPFCSPAVAMNGDSCLANTTDSLSQPTHVDATPLPITGLNTTNIEANSARLNWDNLGTGITYTVQYRVVGSSAWTTLSNLTTNSYTFFFNLTVGTAYEWQVKASTESTYSGPVTFTTLCPAPQYTGNTPARISASLGWSGNGSPAYTLQWRPQGAADWTTVGGITSTSYSLTGLTAATAYEWQVQSVCSGTTSSTFTSPQSFTTYSCVAPNGLSFYGVTSSSTTLNWYVAYQEPGRTFELQYRPVGTTTWASVSSITATTYSLTGLANNTTYEWQVKSVCSPTESSSYTPAPNTFTTFCFMAAGLSSSNPPSPTSVSLYWSYAGFPAPGTTYELQYRPVGSPNWITMADYTTGSSYGSRLLTGLTTNTTYEARFRTVCSPSAYSNFTPTITFTTGCYAPIPSSLNSYTVLSSSTRLSWWLPSDEGRTFDLRYRSVGAADWTTVSSLTTTSYNLTGLTSNTPYEWQVRTVCSATESSTFTPGSNFTTRCLIPTTNFIYAQVTSALLSWSQTEPGATYEARYRLTGTTDWTVLSNLTSASVIVSGLTSNTNYEWQVRARCIDESYSDFTYVRTFQTASCSTPTIFGATTNTNSARLPWTFSGANADTRYEIRYRVNGTTNWITLSNLTSTNGYGYVDITGLPNNTQYEWQIRTVCSATESSAFTNSSYFTIQCAIPNYLNASAQVSSARFSWEFNLATADTRYEIRYRAVGAANWITISNLTTTNGTGYTDVTGLTNSTPYEWQIRTFCSATEISIFTPGPNFTTQCSTPSGYTGDITLTSAKLNWYINNGAVGVTYDVRHRLAGTTDWTTISNLTSTTATLSSLTSNTVYEWQVRTRCSEGINSDFSSVTSFTTASCAAPFIYTSNITATSARLNWNFYAANADTRYEARYRMVGETNWITLSNLTSTNGYGFIDLTGLTNPTIYEWQIRTICSANESSAFSSSLMFRTLTPSPCLSMYTIKTGSWTDPAVWSCNRVPVNTDVVQIRHLVTVPVNAVVFAQKVGFDAGQKVVYSPNSQLKTGL